MDTQDKDNVDKDNNKEKQKRIKAEKNKLMRLFREYAIDENINAFLEKSIKSFAFIAIEMEDLQSAITEKSKNLTTTTEIRNYKDSVSAYNGFMKNYLALGKQLASFLTDKGKKEVQDSLTAFLNK